MPGGHIQEGTGTFYSVIDRNNDMGKCRECDASVVRMLFDDDYSNHYSNCELLFISYK